MKIGIDISQLAFPGTGVASYTRNLVENLLKIDKQSLLLRNKENEYVLFFSSLRQPPPKDFKSKNFKLPPLLLEILWNRLHVLPIEKFIGKVDVLHTSDWLEPPARCSKVTTIHDLVVYKYPETLHPRIVSNQRRKLEWVKRESEVVIAVSEATKKDIIEILGIPERKIRVIYEAPDEIYNKQQTTNNRDEVRKKYGIKGDYILAVGTREPRKNLKRVIEAFSQLTTHPPAGEAGNSLLKLVIAGKFGWGEDFHQSLITNHQSPIIFTGYVPKEDLAPLYAGAQVFVYPSLYEGFGLPILEAMACGCPVVTSNISSMPEVAGEAAVLVDPENVEDITRGIKEAIKRKSELVKKGKSWVKNFSWEKAAKETLKVYKEAYAHRS